MSWNITRGIIVRHVVISISGMDEKIEPERKTFMADSSDFRVLQGGDSCIIIDFGEQISMELNNKVHNLNNWIGKKRYPGLIETVPTYRSLAVYFEPGKFDLQYFTGDIENLEPAILDAELPEKKVIHIPVSYGNEFGPDLLELAEYHGLTPDKVITIHSSPTYHCYMIGFTPGFPYLGGLDERLATPRLLEPRNLIPSGSVGIAGNQTGIYPIESPGGWRIIGRTPLKLFDPSAHPPVMIRSGWSIRFYPVPAVQYEEIMRMVISGRYVPEITGSEDL